MDKTIRLPLVTYVALFIFSIAIVAMSAISVEASPVVIGQATNGENGGVRGCTAGDQTGKEVALTEWKYGSGAYNWTYVFRAKDQSVAKKLAENMKAAAANEHIGYDQNTPDRNSLYDEAQKVGWDISAITENCETTCGSVLSVCINAAGIEVPRTWYSEIIPKDIMNTGEFDCYTSSEYVSADAKLLPGDILVNSNHSAMVVESPNTFTFTVKYIDEKGKVAEAEIEEGETIFINSNNGEETKEVVIRDSMDLKDIQPNRDNASFSGWTVSDNHTFIANFSLYRSSIPTSNKDLKTLND